MVSVSLHRLVTSFCGTNSYVNLHLICNLLVAWMWMIRLEMLEVIIQVCV